MKNRLTQRFQRVQTQIPLEWTSSFDGTICNISEGGLYYRTSIRPPVGSRLHLRFALPRSAHQIEVPATVRWIATHDAQEEVPIVGIGLEFLDLDREARNRILQYVQQIETAQPGTKLPQPESKAITVQYRFIGKHYQTTATDINTRSIFLLSKEPLEMSDVIHMKFRLPGIPTLMSIRGVVRWRHADIPKSLETIIPKGMGVEFSHMSDDEKQLIEQYVLEEKKPD